MIILQMKCKIGDIFIYSDVGPGGVIAAVFPNSKHYFLCDPTWDVDEAYKSYAPTMEIVHNLGDSHDWEFLKNYTGRIWLIHSADMWIYEVFPKENTRVLKDLKQIYTSYHDYSYGVMLLEKYK